MTTGDVDQKPKQQPYINTNHCPSSVRKDSLNQLKSPNMSPKVFFVTGTSTGFGAEYVKKIIAEGDHAIATARNSSKLEKPEGATNKNYLAVDLDVTKKDSIDAAFKKAIEKFGRLDVVVNK